jgi:hypothetical protein
MTTHKSVSSRLRRSMCFSFAFGIRRVKRPAMPCIGTLRTNAINNPMITGVKRVASLVRNAATSLRFISAA